MSDPVKADPALTHLVSAWKHTRPLVACRVCPNGKYAFTGAEDNLLTRWNLADGKSTNFSAHESWVRAIAFSKQGDTVYSGSYDGRVCWWPVEGDKPEPTRKFDAHAGWVRALAVSPDGSKLASAGNDKLVKIWDTTDGKLIAEFPGHESHVYNVAFHPTDGTLASCDLKGNVKQWDLAAAKATRDIPAAALYKYDNSFRADIGGARSIAFSTDGKRLALSGITNVSNAFAGIGNAAVVLVDWESGKPAVQYEAAQKVNGVGWGVRQHADGFWIGLSGGGSGGLLYYWKDATVQEFHKFNLPASGRDLDLLPDNLRLLVAHSDSQLRIYSMTKKPT